MMSIETWAPEVPAIPIVGSAIKPRTSKIKAEPDWWICIPIGEGRLNDGGGRPLGELLLHVCGGRSLSFDFAFHLPDCILVRLELAL